MPTAAPARPGHPRHTPTGYGGPTTETAPAGASTPVAPGPRHENPVGGIVTGHHPINPPAPHHDNDVEGR